MFNPDNVPGLKDAINAAIQDASGTRTDDKTTFAQYIQSDAFQDALNEILDEMVVLEKQVNQTIGIQLPGEAWMNILGAYIADRDILASLVEGIKKQQRAEQAEAHLSITEAVSKATMANLKEAGMDPKNLVEKLTNEVQRLQNTGAPPKGQTTSTQNPTSINDQRRQMGLPPLPTNSVAQAIEEKREKDGQVLSRLNEDPATQEMLDAMNPKDLTNEDVESIKEALSETPQPPGSGAPREQGETP